MAERQLIKKLEQLVQKSNRRNRNPSYFDLLQDLRCADPADRDKAWFLHESIINVLEDRRHKPLTQGQRHYLHQLERVWRARADISDLVLPKLKALGLDVTVETENG